MHCSHCRYSYAHLRVKVSSTRKGTRYAPGYTDRLAPPRLVVCVRAAAFKNKQHQPPASPSHRLTCTSPSNQRNISPAVPLPVRLAALTSPPLVCALQDEARFRSPQRPTVAHALHSTHARARCSPEHLLCEHEHSLQAKFARAEIEQIFQTWP